ncbi:MAG: hypothetical protein ACR2L3_00755 [Actinomycetota bacterium]
MSGIVLGTGLALGVGAPSVVDLGGVVLLLALGRAIRLPSSIGAFLPWLAISLSLGAVAFRWGSPSVEAIQGAQGVLGLRAGEPLSLAGLIFAGLGGLLGLSVLVGSLPSDLEERILYAAAPVAGGLVLGAVFLGRAGDEFMVLPLGVFLGAVAIGIALLLEKASEALTEALGYVAPFLAGFGAILVAIRL